MTGTRIKMRMDMEIGLGLGWGCVWHGDEGGNGDGEMDLGYGWVRMEVGIEMGMGITLGRRMGMEGVCTMCIWKRKGFHKSHTRYYVLSPGGKSGAGSKLTTPLQSPTKLNPVSSALAGMGAPETNTKRWE